MSLQLIDIGVNLTDPIFRGVYNGKKIHRDDFADVLNRASAIGVKKMIITAGRIADANDAILLAQNDERLFLTVGCHPTRCNEFESAGDPDQYYEKLLNLATNNMGKVVAIGECGLDYDREQFCPRSTQLKYFDKQLHLAAEANLPVFMHMRNAASDLIDLYRTHRDNLRGAVAHCFTGTAEEAKRLIELGINIGITGCSLKTEDNLETVNSIPLENIMIETDAPWCEMRPTHASARHIVTNFPVRKKERWQEGCCVKSRNEPCHLMQVLEVVAAVREQPLCEIADVTFRNTVNLFF